MIVAKTKYKGATMKKILIVVFTILFVGLTGCTIDEKPVISHQDVDLVIELIELLPEEITEKDRDSVQLARDYYNLLTDDEKALITNLNVLENAELIIESIEAEKIAEEERKQEIIEKLKELEPEISAYVPEVVNDNIPLPEEAQIDEGKVNIVWRSTNPTTVSTLGVVIPSREDIEVELTAILIFDGIRYEFGENVVVEAIKFDPLPEQDLVFAYAYSARGGFNEMAIETIDVVNHAFSSVINGVVSIGASGRSDLLELRKQGIRVNLCIGGYHDDAIPISQAARTKAGREKLAKSIVEAIEQYHFDGIDLDWEYPGYYSDSSGYEISQAEDTKNYSLLVKEIKRQVKAANSDYLVTAAVPGGPWGPARYNIAEISKHLDYLLLMTYDLHANHLHHTALYPSEGKTTVGCTVQETVDYYKNQGAPANKLIIGAAFYGRVVSINSSRHGSSFNYDHILLRMEKDTVTKHWDDVAKAPYLIDSENNDKISYDDSESIKYKIEYLKDEGLAGIMFWEYTADTSRDLLQSIHDNMK